LVAVVDFDGGNIGSLIAALERRGSRFCVTGDPEIVASARAAILPGDGAFGATMRALVKRGLDEAIRMRIATKKPLLGICVGMQLLHEESDEHGYCKGFGYFHGRITRFQDAPRIPHMGWNGLEVVGRHPFVANLGERPYAYFLHSFRAEVGTDTQATSTHGERFTAIAARDHVMGTQFHPEKSQALGARLLDNFLRIIED